MFVFFVFTSLTRKAGGKTEKEKENEKEKTKVEK
jgi:hypothetical protein